MIEDPFNLLEIERGLRELESTGGKAALELKRFREALAAKRKELREAKAYAKAQAPKGPVFDRAAFIDEHTSDLQFEVEMAEIQSRYGADMVNERASKRSALQTRAKLAIEAMKLAGYGGGA